ncbi:serine hydrolase domain-containing protein [Schlesneria sp. T3-172]|uniref:serine hydrolase domain-containing protein n=1 Tax=Schlesneria sphaerica TaxID=3373610 RepID=UPI0037C63778
MNISLFGSHVATSRREMLKRLGFASCIGLVGRPREMQAAERRLDVPFDRLVQSFGYDNEGPGLAVLVHQSGQPEYMRCVGLATIKDRQPVTTATMFELASVTKSITATAILMLQDRQQLKVTDDVRKYIPELPEYDKKNPIQIRHLAQHTSGLASYMDIPDVLSKHPDYTLNSDYVGEFARQNVPLDFPTGQKYAYNNTNYLLLAEIIARVTGTTYGQHLRDAIFDPAGMKTAFVSEGPGSVPVVAGRVDAIGYGQEEGEWKPLWGVPPARQEKLLTCGDGAVWCSLEDMLAWDRALRAKKLMKPDTAKLAVVPSRTRDGRTNPYGYGWELYYNNPKQLNGFGHGGGWGGFGTYYYHDILTGLTTVMLGNGRPIDMNKFWYALMDLVNKHGLS